MECSPRHSQLLYIPATHYSPPVINLFLTLVCIMTSDSRCVIVVMLDLCSVSAVRG